MLKYASLTLPLGYNIERGEGVEKWKFEIEKLTRLTKEVFFEECLNCFCPWLSELHFTQYEAFRASLLFRLLSST